MRHRIALLALLLPAAAVAEVEITPQIGYRYGGIEVDTGIVCIQSPCPSFAASDDELLYGAALGVPLSDGLLVELLVNRQSADLEFKDWPGGPPNGLPSEELDVTHLHAGLMRLWRLSSVEPFVVLGVGRTWLDARSPAIGRIDLDRWSTSLGAGARVPFGEGDRYALRLEARGYWVDLPSDRLLDGRFVRTLEGTLTQVETTAGITFRF